METQETAAKKETRFKVGDEVLVAFPCTVIKVVEDNTQRWDEAHQGNPLRLVVQTGGDEVFDLIEDDVRLFGPDYLEADWTSSTRLAAAIGGRYMRIEAAEDSSREGLAIRCTPTIVVPAVAPHSGT